MEARQQAIDRSARLAQALKALRRRRGRTVADMARAMGLPRRSYEHFESGRTQLNMARLHQAAAVLDADPYAIRVALEIGSPAFAVRCADNKLVTLVFMALQEFDAEVGDDIALLDPATVMAHLTGLTDALAQIARHRRALLSQGPEATSRAPDSDRDPDPTG